MVLLANRGTVDARAAHQDGLSRCEAENSELVVETVPYMAQAVLSKSIELHFSGFVFGMQRRPFAVGCIQDFQN